MKMQKWLQEKDLSHYKDNILDVSEQDLKNRTHFYCKMKPDIKFDRLDYNVWEAAMGITKCTLSKHATPTTIRENTTMHYYLEQSNKQIQDF